LKKPKILIFDEATSTVDNETDNIIQNMIRLKFINTTILTIAHRLNTVAECDRIMIIDSGC
jgi:ABC-type multidrug transport system fused ATPase/permease subunit